MLCPESEFVVNKEVSLMELMALVLNVVAKRENRYLKSGI